MALAGPSASTASAATQAPALTGGRPRLPAALGCFASAIAGAAACRWFDSGEAAVAALAVVSLVAALVAVRWSAPPSISTQAHPADEGALSNYVVPVWQRNVEAARIESERSMGGLLESFANVSSKLDGALGSGGDATTLEFDAADQLLERHRAELDALKAPATAALRLKDNMARGVAEVAEALGVLTSLAREVQAISRATHLLSLNASVEAARAGANGGGFAVVAQEVRQLAAQSREVGVQIGRRVKTMQDGIRDVQRSAKRHDLDDAELVRRLDEVSRAAVLAVLGSVSEFSRSSRTLREAGEVVQTELEKISMSLQSQDRLSQMLTSATDDMARYMKWLQGEHDPAAAVPALWLERLEASYTMEEMRASHHDTVKVDRAPAVEFF